MDTRDLHVYGGLLLVGIGGFLLSPAWTLIGIGAVLTVFGVFVPRRSASTGPS